MYDREIEIFESAAARAWHSRMDGMSGEDARAINKMASEKPNQEGIYDFQKGREISIAEIKEHANDMNA